jgi:AraC-like DNA-binding protein
MPVTGAMQPADLAPKVFSTVGLPAARRVELWETHNATALIGLDVRAGEPLIATELNVRLPRVDLARVGGPAHVVRRTREVIERSPADAIAVYLTLRGDAWFEWADGVHALRPGNALICDTDRPFARGFRAGLEELVVKADRAALPAVPRLTGPVIASFRDPGASGQYARALAKITGRAARTGQPRPADESTVLDLIAVLAGGRAVAPATAHRAAARSYIEEHLTDPGLGAEQVAAAIGISERQLSRILAADGTSIPRHILSRRLHLAYSMLSSDAAGTGTVADIAARCGFTSATYFSHAFRQHFGQRASDVRSQFPALAG